MATATIDSAARPAADPYAHKWLIAVGVTLASVMELIDTSIINVAIPDMSANLGVTIDEITWVSVGYILASVIVLPMTGWLSSYFGRKRYFTTSIIIFTTASFFCGAAHSLVSLTAWRIVQGIGGGALISTSQAILFESFPREQRTLAAAVFGIGMMIGPAIGPTLGGVIVDRYSWPWIFYVNLPFGILAALMVMAYVRDSVHQERPGRIDVPGFVLLAVGIGSLQFVLERGEHYEWFDSRLIVGLLALAVVAIVVMIWWELHTDEPVLDLRVLKDRSLAAGSTFAAALGAGLYGSIFALPIYLQQLRGYDAAQTGWILFPGAVGSAVAMFGIARFGQKIDLRWLVAAGAVIMAYSMRMHAQFTMLSGGHDFFWPVVLRGFGTGLMFVPLATSAMANLHGRDMAQGTAIFNLTRQLGGSLGIAALATLLTRNSGVYRARLVEHLTTGDVDVYQRLTMLKQAMMTRAGSDSITAKQQALAILDRTVQGQATMLAFDEIFRIVGVLLLVMLPLVLLLRRPHGGPSMGGH